MKNIFFLIAITSIVFNMSKILNKEEYNDNKRTIYVGTSGDYKPVSFYDKAKNEYIGIDIELSKLFAKEKNYILFLLKQLGLL